MWVTGRYDIPATVVFGNFDFFMSKFRFFSELKKLRNFTFDRSSLLEKVNCRFGWIYLAFKSYAGNREITRRQIYPKDSVLLECVGWL
jgi:hypothetical protein